MGLLICFSYGNIILNFINQNGLPFEDKILESHKSNFAILSNIGLVAMLYVDKLITHFITKQNNNSPYIDVIIIVDIILSVAITVMAQLMIDKLLVPIYWFKLSYLFILFIALLIIYKAETLKIRHLSSNSDILPTNNI
jgi:hypothetical protein